MRAAAVLTAFLAAPLAAQAVKDQPVVTLDPGKAYVFYETDKYGTALKLIREANDADRADYEKRRTELFAKAYKRWERNHADWIAQRKAAAASGIKPGAEPVEPVEATFVIQPIEVDLMVQIGPFNRFAKAGDASSYLHAVDPGVYRVYGPIALTPQNAIGGTCMCMGSVKFDAAAGAITDMGRVTEPLYEALQAAKGGAGEKPKTALDLPPAVTSLAIEPAKADDATDARLNGLTVRPAAYRASGRVPNFFGVEIDRLQAMPGVLRYDRDRIIDVASGQEVK